MKISPGKIGFASKVQFLGRFFACTMLKLSFGKWVRSVTIAILNEALNRSDIIWQAIALGESMGWLDEGL